MLTTLQERILRIVADLPETGGFALVGGAALIVHGVVEHLDREHYEIDDHMFRAPSTWVADLRLELGSPP